MRALCQRMIGLFVDSKLLAAGAAACIAAAALVHYCGGADWAGFSFLLLGLPACLWASIRVTVMRV